MSEISDADRKRIWVLEDRRPWKCKHGIIDNNEIYIGDDGHYYHNVGPYGFCWGPFQRHERRAIPTVALAQARREGRREGRAPSPVPAALKSALEHMVYLFAYDDGNGFFCCGGLSALEEAFEALGWADKQPIPKDMLCDEPGCTERRTCGIPTPQGYRGVCNEHYRILTVARKEGEA